MSEEEVMDLELKSESPEGKEKRETGDVKEIVKENIIDVIRILRDEGYEIIEPVQTAESSGEEAPRAKKKTGKKTRVIGFSGKGGVGKTTLAALFLRTLLERDSPLVLAIDADPNMTLPRALGAENYETLNDIVKSYVGGRIPPVKFMQDFDSLLLRNEQDGYDLLPMGRSEDQGCYCHINNLLRVTFGDHVLGGNYAYDYVVMDCEAGIEHISRKTSADVDDLVIVTDGSRMSLETIENILETSGDVKVDIDNFYVVANRLEDSEIIERIKEISDSNGLIYLGNIPEDEEVKKLNFEGKSVFELSDDSGTYLKVKEMSEKILS